MVPLRSGVKTMTSLLWQQQHQTHCMQPAFDLGVLKPHVCLCFLCVCVCVCVCVLWFVFVVFVCCFVCCVLCVCVCVCVYVCVYVCVCLSVVLSLQPTSWQAHRAEWVCMHMWGLLWLFML